MTSDTTSLNVLLIEKSYQAAEVIVSGGRDPQTLTTSSPPLFAIDPKDFSKMPMLGDKDIFRLLQLLPAVNKANDYSAGLIIRGGESSQQRILLDGVPLFNPYHFGGFTSAVNPDILSRADLYPSNYPPEFNGVATGVLALETTSHADSLHGRGTMSVVALKGTADVPLGNGTLTLSASRLYLDIFAKIAGEPLPYAYYDLFAKYSWNITNKQKVFASVFFTHDSFDAFSQPNNDPFYRTEYVGKKNEPNWGNLLGNLIWVWDASETQTISVQAYSSLASVGASENVNRIENRTNFLYKHEDVYIDNNVHEWAAVIKDDLKLSRQNISVGVKLRQIRLTDHWNIPQRISNAPDPLQDIFFDYAPTVYDTAMTRTSLAAFATDNLMLFSTLHLTLGGRAEYLYDQKTMNLYPFARIQYKPTYKTELYAGYGKYHQELVTVAENKNATIFSPFKTPFFERSQYPVEVHHVTLGLKSFNILPNTDVAVEAFAIRKKNLPFIRPDDRSLQVYTETIGGMDIFLRYAVPDFDGWLSSSYSRAKRDEGNAVGPGNFDQPHVAKAVAAWHLSEQFDLSASWVYTSGLPYSSPTEYVVFNYSTEPVYTNVNNQRSNDYHRLDATLTYTFRIGKVIMKPFLTIVNLYHHDNAVILDNGLSTGTYGTLPKPYTKTLDGLPTVPIIGLNVEL